MNSVICPTLLFIEKKDWKDNDKKEKFQKKLSQLIDFIKNTESKIYWNDILEGLLWLNPNLYPWYDSNSYAISEPLHQCMFDLPNSMSYIPCLCSPKIKCNIFTIDIISPTLSLTHYLFSNKLVFDFLVDDDNCFDFIFSCICHNNSYNPNVLSSFEVPIDISTEINKYWDTLDDCNFKYIINLVANKYFLNIPLKYDIQYESSFLNKIKAQNDYRESIIYAIVSRLTKYQKDATQDKSLKDEPIKGKKIKKRRFRVRVSNGRIHYIYKDTSIKFLNYYTESEHDDGL